jgi:hypothetical protein
MIVLLSLVLSFALHWPTDKKDGPLVSDKGTLYLSCTVWTGKTWTTPTARKAKTPLLTSAVGLRAYAEVNVEVHSGDCENVVTLFIASRPDPAFKSIKVPIRRDGGGIRLVGWSPNGKRLLFELNQWAYETDTGFTREPLIFDADSNSISELHELDHALNVRFGSECEFEHSAVRWRTDYEFSVKVSQTPPNEGYEQHFCVESPVFLIYNTEKKTISSLPNPTKKLSK